MMHVSSLSTKGTNHSIYGLVRGPRTRSGGNAVVVLGTIFLVTVLAASSCTDEKSLASRTRDIGKESGDAGGAPPAPTQSSPVAKLRSPSKWSHFAELGHFQNDAIVEVTIEITVSITRSEQRVQDSGEVFLPPTQVPLEKQRPTPPQNKCDVLVLPATAAARGQRQRPQPLERREKVFAAKAPKAPAKIVVYFSRIFFVIRCVPSVHYPVLTESSLIVESVLPDSEADRPTTSSSVLSSTSKKLSEVERLAEIERQK